MLTREENELVTRTGPGTPGGDLLRRYWLPAALEDELPPGGSPLPLRIMGEDLVLFRDEQGRLGLLGTYCSHRGADLSYGRVENGGLRCLYHGWLYDVQGRCLEQPAEPEGSRFFAKVQHKAYPCQEFGGFIFAYMGPGEPPLLPKYEAFLVPPEYRFVYKIYAECNYLQASEGNIDPAHLSFLHRMSDELARAIRGQRYATVAGAGTSNALYAADLSPKIDVEETDFGLRIISSRRIGDGKTYLRVSNFLMPNFCAVAGETLNAGWLGNWVVPIDDETHWRFVVFFSREAPLEKERFRSMYDPEMGPGFRPRRHKANRYLQDREEQKTQTFTGMGTWFHTHDLYASESVGPIWDRTQERLGYSDKAVITMRRQLLDAIKQVQKGKDPIHVVRDPAANDFSHIVVVSEAVSETEDLSTYWRKARQRQDEHRQRLLLAVPAVAKAR